MPEIKAHPLLDISEDVICPFCKRHRMFKVELADILKCWWCEFEISLISVTSNEIPI